MPATHSPMPARAWIVRLARVCWERKTLSIIVIVASVSTILLAALTPLITRQAVNDAIAGDTTLLACGLLLIALFDFIGNYVRRGYAGELSLWVQHTLRSRAFDSIQKLDGAGQDALRTGQVISRTNSDLQQVHTLLQMCPVPMAVLTYYVVGQIIGLDVEKMSFHYDNGNRILNEISFSIHAGETVAVVGASGSGKSTLLMLLARFYDPTSGGVWLNTTTGQQNIRDLKLTALRRRVGVVFEDAFLFAGTVAENIAYGHPQATQDDIRRAADAAGASGFINALPQGFNTRLTERGSNLSGGQRQRIALARALITAPELLILDDTTSAVDAGTEAEINTALGRYADNEHMLLVIARRRSTLQLADRIVVLDKGRVVDIGTQAELDARCPTFRSLMSGEGDFLALAPAEQRTLWPTTQAVKSDDAHERQTPAGKGFVDRMTRVPERAVQMALAGHGRQVSSLLTPVAWMFVIAALLIALDSAAGVGVLVLLQRGIDSGVAAGDMSTIGICALLALCLVAIGSGR